jgi:hypothetical protein
LSQKGDPVHHDFQDVASDGKEPRRECLGELRIHLPRILVEPALGDVDVSEFDGCRGSVAGTSKDREGDDRAIAPFDLSVRRHHLDGVSDLL